MAFERKWPVVPPQAFTADGGEWGLVTVANTAGFRVKQSAYLLAVGLEALPVQVKVVLSPTQLVVGKIDNQIANWPRLDIRAFTVLNNASIGAQEQDKNKITNEDIQKAVYEADPVVALRTIGVDQYGNFYTPENPLPVDFEGSISIDTVKVIGTNGNIVEPNEDGSLNTVEQSNAIGVEWDDVLLDRDPITQDLTVATFKKNNVTVRTLTFTYDANENLIEVKKT